MTYRGQVKNGVVVLEGETGLREGMLVRVEPIEAPTATPPPRGSSRAILQAVRGGAHWQGDPAELDQFLFDLKAGKRAEAEAELERARNGEPHRLGE